MKLLNKCPVKIPASGNSLFKIDGVTLYFRSQKPFTEVYEVKSRCLIMGTTRDREYILKKCLERIDEIKALSNDCED